MHNIHLIRLNAKSLQDACQVVNEQLNPVKMDLDFSNLKVDPDHFTEIFFPYSEESFSSFQEYLENLIDPEDTMRYFQIDDDLRDKGYHQTAQAIDKFLQAAGHEPGTNESFFDFEVIASISSKNELNILNNTSWDLTGLSINSLNDQLKVAYGRQFDLFDKHESNELEGAWETFGLTDWVSSLTDNVYVVLVDVRS